MGKIELKDFALVAEIVASIAVIVTIAFLAIEMRSNTDALRAQTYHDLIAQINDWRKLTVTDRELAALVVQRNSDGWSSLDPIGQRQYLYRELVLWGIYESAYFSKERGILGDEEWIRFELAICRRYARSDNWNPPQGASMTTLLTPAFSTFVVHTCE